MKQFACGHATHPRWPVAAALVLTQLRAQLASPEYADTPTLALLYITDHYAAEAQEILNYLSAELPDVLDWAGTVGVGIAVSNAEYFDEPAMALMLCDLPADQYRVFSGVAPLGLGFEAHTALVHADPHTLDLQELISEMAQRTETGYLFGGVSSSRTASVQFAVAADGNIKGQGAASGVFSGGLSGVAFGRDVALVSRVTQGCLPLGDARTVTRAQRNVVLALDGRPALDVLLNDLGVSLANLPAALAAVRQTLVGLVPPKEKMGPATDERLVRQTGNFGADVVVRHIIGLDPAEHGVAVADWVAQGSRLAFCQRNVKAARADLIRVCTEIREEFEQHELLQGSAAVPVAAAAALVQAAGRRMAGAVYVSCSGRGGPHFGGPSAELQVVRRALGEVPLVGFFAGGEIARDHLYGYTGVLTVFVAK